MIISGSVKYTFLKCGGPLQSIIIPESNYQSQSNDEYLIHINSGNRVCIFIFVVSYGVKKYKVFNNSCKRSVWFRSKFNFLENFISRKAWCCWWRQPDVVHHLDSIQSITLLFGGEEAARQWWGVVHPFHSDLTFVCRRENRKKRQGKETPVGAHIHVYVLLKGSIISIYVEPDLERKVRQMRIRKILSTNIEKGKN